MCIRDRSVSPRTDAVIVYKDKNLFVTAKSKPTFDFNADAACEPYVSANHGGAETFTSCPGLYGLRSVRIYSPDRGDIVVTNNDEDGAEYVVPHTSGAFNKTGGNFRFIYTPPCANPGVVTDCANYLRPHGYTFIVKSGANVTIHVPNALDNTAPQSDLFTMEYSETHLDETNITVTVTGDSALNAGPIKISSKHTREWITAFGPLVPQSGAWWNEATQWVTKGNESTYRVAWDSYIAANTIPDGACEPDSCDGAYNPSGDIVFDKNCMMGGVGCNIGGNMCCRLCGAPGYLPC